MGFQEAVTSVFQQYATFSGRARRSEYWYFVLFTCIVEFVLTMLTRMNGIGNVANILCIVFSFAVLIPSLAVSCRRLHDIGRSGFWLFIGLIPIVGGILLIVWHCKDSEPETNQYGPCPK